jgi:serine/threonine protein phosphatase 1
MSKTFAIGDVHGFAEPLQQLLAQIEPLAEEGDTLVFVGDYIDRGPDSRGVIRIVQELQEWGVAKECQAYWPGPVVTLIGNHEDMLLDHLRVEQGGHRLYDAGLWESNGGVEAMKSFLGPVEFARLIDVAGGRRAVTLKLLEKVFLGVAAEGITSLLGQDLMNWFASLKLDYEDEHGYYVHAGFQPGKRPGQCSRFQKLWIRDEWIYDTKHRLDKPVIFGHTPQSTEVQSGIWQPGMKDSWKPLNRPEKIGIDTGSCYGGLLTAVMLPQREFFSVPCQA